VTVATPGTPDDTTGFIRAGGGVALQGRRVAWVLGLLCTAALIAVTAAVAVSDARSNAGTDRLRSQGVPVVVTVTGCLAISSGVGMGIEYWRCRGSYAMGSRTYEEEIGGQRALLERGSRIAAIAVPGDPSLVAVPAALRQRRSYTVAEVIGGVTAALIVGETALATARRRRRRRSV
jgi:hypothetical protein